ncbi:MAG: hypothetical protein AB1668_05770 [Nanoarchaeota archaeon]
MKAKNQSVSDLYSRLSICSQASILHSTSSRIEHDAFIEEAQEMIAPGSLGMISDDYRFHGRSYEDLDMRGIKSVIELTQQGPVYFALSYVPADKVKGPYCGNSMTKLHVYSSDGGVSRARELLEHFKTRKFQWIVLSRHRHKRTLEDSF